MLARPVEEEHAAVLAFLADGESWSSSALALALGNEPAHRAARARRARGSRQGAVVRSRAGAALDDAARAGIHDDLVTPRAAADATRIGGMRRSTAEIVREYGPFPGVANVHGVTYDGQHVWFAARRQAERLRSRERRRRCARSMSPRMPEPPSTAGTCSRSPRIASRRSIRRPAACSPRSPRPAAAVTRGSRGPKGRSGSGSIATGRSIRSIPRPGAILRTIESNRFVTGVTWVDGELWHGTWEGDESDLRRVDPRTGEVLERLEMPPGVGVSGLESDGGDRFFCGGGGSGKLRAVRRPPKRR